MFHKLVSIAAWALLTFIVYATISPIHARPASFASTSLEHFAAFAVLGALFCFAYPTVTAEFRMRSRKWLEAARGWSLVVRFSYPIKPDIGSRSNPFSATSSLINKLKRWDCLLAVLHSDGVNLR
jgi:hypothetical protein